MDETLEPEDLLLDMLAASGFVVFPIQTVIDALAESERYLRDATGLSQDELEVYVRRINLLLGQEESCNLSLDEIVGWIRALQGS